MNISFENKVALVTGAASGLGLATAKAFGESGASVVLADWNEKEAQAAATRVQERETQKAIAAAEQIIVKAREVTVQEHALMLVELKREVGRLVLQATATVTGMILTPNDQRRLAEETTRQLAA